MFKILILVLFLSLMLAAGCANNNDIVQDEEPLDIEEAVISSEKIVSSKGVTKKLNLTEALTEEQIEETLEDYSLKLREEYPDHRIIVEAYQDGELVAEKELE